MDIVSVNQTFGLGGAENFNLSLARHLSKENQIHFYTNFSKFANLIPDLNPKIVPIVVDLIGDWKGFVKAFVFLPLLLAYYLFIIFSHPKADIYYFTGYIEKIIMTPFLKLIGKKIVWIEFGPLDFILSKFMGIPKFLYLLASRYPNICIFSSRNSMQKNLHYFPKTVRLSVINLGSPPPPPKVLPIDQIFDVLCISRLETGKGQDLLIESWAKVVRALPKATLCIAGEGDGVYVSKLKHLISKYELTRNVMLMGRVDNKYGYIQKSKFTVFPSVWDLEGFGLVVTESLSMGKPVVAYDRAPGNEIIKSGYNGILSRSLEESIILLLKNPKMLTKLSHNARLSWEKSFREEIYLKKYAHAILC